MTWLGVSVYISLPSSEWVVLFPRNRVTTNITQSRPNSIIFQQVLAAKTNPLPEISDRKPLYSIQVLTRVIFRSWKVRLNILSCQQLLSPHMLICSKNSYIYNISKKSFICFALKVCSLATLHKRWFPFPFIFRITYYQIPSSYFRWRLLEWILWQQVSQYL